MGRRRSWRRVVQFQGIPRRTAAKAVLGSWCYTRRDGQRCSKWKATQFQGIPSGVTLGTNSPEGGDDLIYTSSSRWRWCDWQSVLYTRVVWVTAITLSQLFYCLYQVTDFHFVYNRSLTFNCVYTRSLYLTLFIKGGGINHTSVHGVASAWAAGTLLQSDCDGACGRAS